MTDIKSKFYLTGGTAVSRFMLHHRFSDDLDFFLNYDNDFSKEAERVAIKLSETLKENADVTYRSSTFYRIIIKSDKFGLKLDLVNDVGYHAGGFFENNKYHKIDNERNILSNKVTALQRNAPKDIADILYLSFKYRFNWMSIIEDAKQKDTWVNEIEVATKLHDFPIESLKEVKWRQEQNYNYLQESLHIIAKDILMAADNSLSQKKR